MLGVYRGYYHDGVAGKRQAGEGTNHDGGRVARRLDGSGVRARLPARERPKVAKVARKSKVDGESEQSRKSGQS